MKTVLIAVMSIDGCITRHDGSGAGSWASPEDQAHFRASSSLCDVRIFGSGTYTPDRDWFRTVLAGGVRRVVMTRRPDEFAADAVAGQLEFTSESPGTLIDRLRSDGHTRCAILGGGAIYGAFLREDLIDEIELTIEPVMFGSGVRLAGGDPIDQRFELVSIEKLNASTLLARYRRPIDQRVA